MSDKAETMECVDCSGRGFRGVLGGLCPTCNGMGLSTTGAVVGVLAPNVVDILLNAPRDYQGCRPVSEFPTETRGEYATAAVYKCNSKECGGLSLESGLFEGLRACGASVTEVRDVSKDQYRRMVAQADTIAAQAAEIERLKARLDECLAAGQSDNADAAQWRAVSETMRGRRDTAEAERDQVLSLVERLNGDIEELTIQRDTAIDGRDELRAMSDRQAQRIGGLHDEVERLKGENRRLAGITSKYQDQWQRLVTRLEEIPATGLGPEGGVRLDREFVLMALDLDKPVPWVDESESDADRAVYRIEESELRTDRDVLRLEVQRLKDLNFEAQDPYAAIEAERDELRENLKLGQLHNGEMASKLAALTAKRDELQLALDTATAKRGFDSDRFKAEAERLTAQAYEANARAESYLRVIDALRYELAVVEHCHAATIRSIVRLANAGLELPEVTDNA